MIQYWYINPLNTELNPICHLLALLAHPILHISRIRVKQVHTLWYPIVYAPAECTSTLSRIWPDDGSTERKHVAEFLILLPI
jgi:hypothetical protein